MKKRPLRRYIEEWPASGKFKGDIIRQRPAVSLTKPNGTFKTLDEIVEEAIFKTVEAMDVPKRSRRISAAQVLGIASKTVHRRLKKYASRTAL